MKTRVLPGINIQYPISRLILTGEKTVETRTYPIPKKYIGKHLALIETPGEMGGFKARITAVIRFGPSFQYASKRAFYADIERHRVTPTSDWKWNPETPKYGWPVEVIERFTEPLAPPKRRGIVFSTVCEI